ncbi:MAG: thioredoxin family protein [Cyclobacteriaceae bacterium]
MIFSILFSTLMMTASGPDWHYDFDQAMARAQKEHKMIILNFAGSDWCGPCIKMTRDIFEKETFVAYSNKNLVLVRADFPRSKKNQLEPTQIKHNEALAEKYNPQGKFPLTLLLDENGKILKSWDGFKSGTPEEFIQQIEQALDAR